MTDIMITEATEADYGKVCLLFKELDSHHAVIEPRRVSQCEGISRSREQYNLYIEGIDRVLFLVKEDDCIVGFVNLMVCHVQGSQLHVERRYTLLENIFVLERCRKQGLASALLFAAERWSADRGVSTIELQLYTANHDALAFYQAKGYGQFMARMERSVTTE